MRERGCKKRERASENKSERISRCENSDLYICANLIRRNKVTLILTYINKRSVFIRSSEQSWFVEKY